MSLSANSPVRSYRMRESAGQRTSTNPKLPSQWATYWPSAGAGSTAGPGIAPEAPGTVTMTGSSTPQVGSPTTAAGVEVGAVGAAVAGALVPGASVPRPPTRTTALTPAMPTAVAAAGTIQRGRDELRSTV